MGEPNFITDKGIQVWRTLYPQLNDPRDRFTIYEKDIPEDMSMSDFIDSKAEEYHRRCILIPNEAPTWP